MLKSTTASTMRVLVRCKILSGHARWAHSTSIDSIIEQAEIFNLVFHRVVLSKARLLKQWVVILPLLAASMSSTIRTIIIIWRVRVTVVTGTWRVTWPAMIWITIAIRALRIVTTIATAFISSSLATEQEHLLMVELLHALVLGFFRPTWNKAVAKGKDTAHSRTLLHEKGRAAAHLQQIICLCVVVVEEISVHLLTW